MQRQTLGSPLVGRLEPVIRSALIIDDDRTTCDTLATLLRMEGIGCRTSDSGDVGVIMAFQTRPDVVVVDLCLPDMSGLDVVRRLRGAGLQVPFVLISGFADVSSTVEAMRLGAISVIEKPFDADELISLLKSALRSRPLTMGPSATNASRLSDADRGLSASPPFRWHALLSNPHSAAERWAVHVLRAAEAPDDFRTLATWARHVGVSYTTLRDSCYVLQLRPRAARDFARLFRVVAMLPCGDVGVEALLDVPDRAALRALCAKAALPLESGLLPPTLATYIDFQRYVPTDNPGLAVLRGVVSHRATIPAAVVSANRPVKSPLR